jgi:SPP1 gp7 family putative phage head morphogenesis protein
MAEALKRKAKEAGEMAARHTAEQAQAFRLTTAAPDSEEVQRRGARRLSKRLTAISADQAEQPYRDIKRRLALGVALGLTLAELVRGLMRVGGRRGKLPDVHDANAVAEAIADSIFGVASRRARMVAVTEIANAYNVQMLIAMDQLDTVTLKRWDARHDKRTCVECYSLDGRVAELRREFPNGSLGPPLHPNCRCYLTIWPSRRPQGDE